VILNTDEGIHYKTVSPTLNEHHRVNHSQGEYVRGDVSTNQAENFFSQLKRSIDGTHNHVLVDHLHRYVTSSRSATASARNQTRSAWRGSSASLVAGG
jgi:hypothetical protein